VAATDSTVLIHGESGTGKELVARALHRNSKRASRPFIRSIASIDGITPWKVSFRPREGAFTGAVAQKKGKIEIADGGTVFLDEIGEMAPPMQAKLLRVLEHVNSIASVERGDQSGYPADSGNESERCGSDQDGSLQAGFVLPPQCCRHDAAAASRSPRRHSTVSDLLWFKSNSREANRPVSGISPEAHTLLKHYDWPETFANWKCDRARSCLRLVGTYPSRDLPEALLKGKEPSGASVLRYHDAVNTVKRQLIIRAVEQAGGNFTEAAKLLNLHPNTSSENCGEIIPA